MFEYQKNKRFFAQAPTGLEDAAAGELAEFGAGDIKKGFRGLYFNADLETLCRINYTIRTATRILAPLRSFVCRHRDDLYRAGMAIEWNQFFSVSKSFGIFANVSDNPKFRHSNFAAQCLKDAIVDFFRSRFGMRPDVDGKNPDIWFNLHIERTRGIISLDTSGGSLHRRGYRQETVAAPVQETLAAAMVAMSGWEGDRPLYDPMCGSGTLLCEAMMRYCGIPSGYLKETFGFQFMPDFNKRLWERMRLDIDAGIRPLPSGLIGGSDKDRSVVTIARHNCRQLPGGEKINLSQMDFNRVKSLEDSVILCNPPYGIRLKTEGGLPEFYQGFGDFLKQRCKGATAYLLFGDRELIKHVGLKATWKKPVRNAGLDSRIVRYDIDS